MYGIKYMTIEFDEDMELKIVGSTEANSLEGKISNESPVGKALMGKKRRCCGVENAQWEC